MATPSLDPSTWTPAQRARMSAEAAKLRTFREAFAAERTRLDAANDVHGPKYDATTGCYTGPGGVSVCMRSDVGDLGVPGAAPVGRPRSRIGDALTEAVGREELSDEELRALSAEIDRAIAWRAERSKASSPEPAESPAGEAAEPKQEPADVESAERSGQVRKRFYKGEPCACAGKPGCECEQEKRTMDAQTAQNLEKAKQRAAVYQQHAWRGDAAVEAELAKLDAQPRLDTHKDHAADIDAARARRDATARDAWRTTTPIAPGPKKTLDAKDDPIAIIERARAERDRRAREASR